MGEDQKKSDSNIGAIGFFLLIMGIAGVIVGSITSVFDQDLFDSWWLCVGAIILGIIFIKLD